MLAPVHHIIGLTTVTRERLLPIAGTVLVRQGQKVNAGDVIAEAATPREHVLLNVARSLRMHPDKAQKIIKCKEKTTIAANTEIAAGPGLFPRSVQTPRAGKVVMVLGGQVLIEVATAKVEVRAGITGTVSQVIENRGAVIQASGSLIQGVWGNGRADAGLLVNQAEKPDSILSPGQMDVSLRGAVILGGIVKDGETLKAAAELPVRGLIIASLYPSLIPLAREMKYPIMVTEGFGPMPMNSAAYKLLSTNVKRDVSVNAEAFDRYNGTKPEALIALPVKDAPEEVEVVEFAPGLQVKMRRPPSLGMIGTITSIKPGLTLLPSGLRAQAAEIKLDNGETVIAPLVNLEVVG